MTKFGQSVTEYAYDLTLHDFTRLTSQMAVEAKNLVNLYEDQLSGRCVKSFDKLFGGLLDAVLVRLHEKCGMRYAGRSTCYSSAPDDVLRRDFCKFLCSPEMSDARSEIYHVASGHLEGLRCSAFFNQIPNGNILAVAADRIYTPDQSDHDDLSKMVYVTAKIRGHEGQCHWSPSMTSCVIVSTSKMDELSERYAACYA